MGFMGHFEPNMGQNMGFMGNAQWAACYGNKLLLTLQYENDKFSILGQKINWVFLCITIRTSSDRDCVLLLLPRPGRYHMT